ncbi:MAG: VTT domain-containing protein [Actinomycetota bacterium]|nr:VTT domain-containing protein [Actinomycetota bacterium]
MRFLDPEVLISAFGVAGILALVFAESGLLVGFFLPGDSLLFTAGLLVSQHTVLHLPLWQLCLLVTAAAIAGDQVGYATGRRLGPPLFRRPNSRLFKQENLLRTRRFFDRYGPHAVVLARFVPVVRTFTPIVAGSLHVRYRTFTVYNVAGGALWGSGVVMLGYFLGRVPFVRDHIQLILVGVVAVSVAPLGVGWLRGRRSHHAGTKQ